MNRTNIEWTDFTWNPITGCQRLCQDEKGIYCYAYYMALRQRGRNGYDARDPFKPTFHPNRLLEPVHRKKPAKIFTVSMGDIFDDGVPDIWRDLVLQIMYATPQHTYQVLTKRPENIPNFEEPEIHWPSNMWLGVSIDGRNNGIDQIYELCESSFPYTTFVSFEPLLGRIDGIVESYEYVNWAIIGAQTGARAKQPRREWIHDILLWASQNDIPIFMKDNLDVSDGDRVQDYPEAVA